MSEFNWGEIALLGASDDAITLLIDDRCVEKRESSGSVIEFFFVSSCKWQVHRFDADPFPSDPHAHCLDGKHKGKKLSFKDGSLWRGARRTGEKLRRRDFLALCELVQEQRPELTLPIND